jgi:hypothetical protein
LPADPIFPEDGLCAARLRFGEQHVMAVLAGLANRQLVERVSGLCPAPYGCRQATWDLRRLKRTGLIDKISIAGSQAG